MPLEYTLKEMQETLTNLKYQTERYSQAINTIDEDLKKLKESLKTEETGIYETLLEIYNQKKQSLFEAREYMLKLCTKLEEKITDLNDTTQEIYNKFN